MIFQIMQIPIKNIQTRNSQSTEIQDFSETPHDIKKLRLLETPNDAQDIERDSAKKQGAFNLGASENSCMAAWTASNASMTGNGASNNASPLITPHKSNNLETNQGAFLFSWNKQNKRTMNE
eukprot:TRINITY_DN3608_c0_g1_i1.p1 TRINITY_DN3608_c0_g1~~TRINITY_DN3608_c0_g1_i1.p1  ORF type:complete len:122 (+),score=16.19 TRINITY_DN3608_c0_g1_i1:82-447(+)